MSVKQKTKKTTQNMNDQENIKVPTPKSLGQVCDTICRMSAKGFIDDKIHRLERQISNLKTLKNLLPSEMNSHQDEAVWNIICELR